MKKFTKNIKIFITGHRGMVGSSLLNYFKKRKFGKLLYATRSKLNLENYNKVNNFIKKNMPEVIINCAGKVGGILANNTYPTEFLNENILIKTNLIETNLKYDSQVIDSNINVFKKRIEKSNSIPTKNEDQD